MARFDPQSYPGLDRLGRIRLSRSFHLREFLYSEIAVHYGLRNVPEAGRIDHAIDAGTQLCERLLEPLQEQFGRVHIRSGYRSRAVNAAGVVGKHNCAADNDGFHTWDWPHAVHGRGATACISIPAVSTSVLAGQVPLESLAWWIHDHLPDWGHVEFFTTPEHSDELCFNIGWSERPLKTITTRRGGPRNLHDALPDAEERTRWAAQLLAAVDAQQTHDKSFRSLGD